MSKYNKMVRITEQTHDSLRTSSFFSKKDMGEIVAESVMLHHNYRDIKCSMEHILSNLKSMERIMKSKIEYNIGDAVTTHNPVPYEEEIIAIEKVIQSVEYILNEKLTVEYDKE